MDDFGEWLAHWLDDVPPGAVPPGAAPPHPPAAAVTAPPAQRAGPRQLAGTRPPARRRQLVAAGLIVAASGGSAGGYLAASGGSAPTAATLDATTGWATPQQAVEALLGAASRGDLLAAMQTLVPGEQTVDVAEAEALVAQLQRLDVLAPSFDLSDLRGLTVTVSGTALSVRELAGGTLALVSLDGGTVTTRTDPGRLALGSFVRSLAGSSLAAPARVSTSPLRPASGWTGYAPLQAAGAPTTGTAGSTGSTGTAGASTGTAGASTGSTGSTGGSTGIASSGAGIAAPAGTLPAAPLQASPALPSGFAPAIVTEKVGDSWYVSLGWTVAAASQQSRGQPFAPPLDGVQAVPSATPEDAVSSLIEDAAALDPAGALSVLPPGEEGAVQAYAGAALLRDTAALTRLRSAVHLSVSGMRLSTEPIGEGQLVKVSGLQLSASVDVGSLRPGGGLHGLLAGASTLRLDWAGGCLTLKLGPVDDHQCGASAGQRAAVSQLLSLLPGDVASSLRRLASVQPDAGFVAVQENGGWYVSPAGTMLHSLQAGLALLQPSDLQAWASFLRDPAALQRVAGGLSQLAKQPTSLLTAFYG